MSKHTPGPLYASGNGVHTRRGTVGYCTGVGYDPDEPNCCTEVAIANARLYAAAPELLAVVQEMCRCKRAGVGGSLKAAGEAAIAKARGESQ